MGTSNKKYPDLISLSRDPVFSNIPNTSVYFVIMSTIFFTYGYKLNLYYLLF